MYEPGVRTIVVSDLDVRDGVGEGALTLALPVSFLPTSCGLADVGNECTVIVPGPRSRSYRVPTLPDPTGYYYCTLQLGCSIVVAICSVHLEVN